MTLLKFRAGTWARGGGDGSINIEILQSMSLSQRYSNIQILILDMLIYLAGLTSLIQ